jgi:transcription-repair coupling factor (superfamily II helicase)
MGYVRTFEVEAKGSFAIRGDILDIYPINAPNPVRVDFFGDTVEKIKPYDFVTGERLPNIEKITILPATDMFASLSDLPKIEEALKNGLKDFKTSEAYTRARGIADELLAEDASGYQNSFLMPLIANATDFFSILPENAVLIFDEGKELWDRFNALYKEHEERFRRLKEGGEAFWFTKNQYIEKEVFLEKISTVRHVAMQMFTGNPFFFQPLKIFNFTATPTAKYLNSLPILMTDIINWRKGGYRVMLYCGDNARAIKMSEQLGEGYISTVKLPEDLTELDGICVLDEKLEQGFVLHESKLGSLARGIYIQNRRIVGVFAVNAAICSLRPK